MRPPPLHTWPSLLEAFRQHQLAAGRSAGTIRLYRYRLLDLAALAAKPADVTEAMLLEVLGNPSWSQETRKGVRTSYRTFFAWAARTRRLHADPAAGLPTVKVPDGVPRPAPEKALRRALAAAGPRERVMVHLAAHAGLRCCEIARVHADDWDGAELLVHGKGGKERLVAITQPPGLVAWLDELDGFAFPNRWTGEPLTAGHVSRLVSRTLPGPHTAHTLRHRYGTTTLEGTGDLLAVAQQMGHAKPETTQRYTAVSRRRRRAVADAAA